MKNLMNYVRSLVQKKPAPKRLTVPTTLSAEDAEVLAVAAELEGISEDELIAQFVREKIGTNRDCEAARRWH